MVTLKILFQILCLDQVDWDQELNGELMLKFLTIRQEIVNLNSIRVPRYYFCTDTKPVTVDCMVLAMIQNKRTAQ
jgi:hypothetical protein